MNDWLEVMLGEIDRKKQESRESREEAERRKTEKDGKEDAGSTPDRGQST